ncbi:protein-disulfide reductase DsbD domain-containing protein [Membranihabitans maritimus]|uniref:protein-disulfide reductase DsbD domain-containing protein n=1 Tax=Membranihabitans maritimus TaxID=2904244 RepID=UPI001F281ED0|nr:protein-disulfide reductase DsbD domain-containing protein [Membranihabitans maritimus]
MRLYVFSFLIVLLSGFSAKSQILNPVEWEFEAIETGDKEFEIKLNATIDKGWHIYSRLTPEGGPIPTSVSFENNRALELIGEIDEEGDLEDKMDDMFGVRVKSYSGSVSFIQGVKLKFPVTTYLVGTVEYMACDDSRCLPPEEKKFKIKL